MTGAARSTLALLAGALTAPAFGGGSLVIVGGALSDDNAPVYRRIVELRLAGRPVCVVPLASAEPERTGHAAAAALARHGGNGVAVAVNLTTAHPERAADPAFAETLSRCGGFFFTGGDQSRIVDTLRPGGGSTPGLEAMRAVLAEGGVVAGTSAGAAIMTDPMIGAGNPEQALREGVAAEESEPGVWLRDGLGFLPGALTDQHFLARGRLGRVLAVLAERTEPALAYGIDEDTALVVGAPLAEVLGASGVLVLDARRAERPETGPGFVGARLYLLGAGDRFDPALGVAEPAPGKAAVPAGRRAPRLPRRPFEGEAAARFLAALAASRLERAALPAGRFSLVLRKGEGFRALARSGRGPLETPRGLFAGPFVADLVPAPAAQ